MRIDKGIDSRNGGKFLIIFFKTEDGKWLKTNLVKSYRNFKQWKPLLRVGNILEGLVLIDKETVDADWIPILREHPELSWEEEKLWNLSKTVF